MTQVCCQSWWKVNGVHGSMSWLSEVDLLERIWIISAVSSVLFFSVKALRCPVCKLTITGWVLGITAHSTSPLFMFLLIEKFLPTSFICDHYDGVWRLSHCHFCPASRRIPKRNSYLLESESEILSVAIWDVQMLSKQRIMMEKYKLSNSCLIWL